MESSARLAASKDHRIISMAQPFSNFDFFEESKTKYPNTLKRILSQIRRLGGKTLVIEELETSEDIASENAELALLFPDLIPGITRRISFFRKAFKTEKSFRSVSEKDILGYVIIKEEFVQILPRLDFRSRIFESVIPIPHKSNNYVRGSRNWNFQVCGHNLSTSGYLYAQQNGYTNCCAHVALKTVLSRYPDIQEVSFEEMNRIIGIDRESRIPGGGLDFNEMVQVLESKNLNCHYWDIKFETEKDLPTFHKYIYGCIESGFPVIVVFRTDNAYHAIPIFGHTLNRDTWVPLAESSYFLIGGLKKYIPSDSWLSMFIGHDDNFGSNICIPRHYLNSLNEAKTDTNKARHSHRAQNVIHVIGTLPNEIKTSPITAEIVGMHYLFEILSNVEANGNKWIRRMKSAQTGGGKNDFVVRTILVKSDEYCTHLEQCNGWKPTRINNSLISPIRNYLSNEFVWLVEFSFLELFSGNLRKLGEVIVRAETDFSTKSHDLEGFLLARLPSCFVTADLLEKRKIEFKYLLSGIEDHTPLYACE